MPNWLFRVILMLLIFFCIFKYTVFGMNDISSRTFSNTKHNSFLNQVTVHDQNSTKKLQTKNCSKASVCSLFVYYINSSYYLGIIPYKIVQDNATGLWKLKTSIAQKVTVLIYTVQTIC